ncbi:putative ribonuclease H-like domain-containing protein [Tanacetum coccineum]|uniref:Ribonuclease H-like domain-containing protein n=1 Tax=Tanacetum coccineum TaxID=301880 RepID=A0ABQ4X419_9ASTR
MTKNVTEHVEPKKGDPSWIEAMQDELLQFKLHKVWTLVDLPYGKRAIGTKWVYRNKKDDRGIVMDVKSDFLYGTIKEEVYVCQPPSFKDPKFPNKVYKVEKALYGLHQAPRAWYETLSTYLLENGFRRGTIDKTLFIKKDKDDILLVQVYVDDIIFGFTKKSLCVEFEQMMHKRFQMSSIGELTFFLRLQVNQKDDGIFISQDKYMADILKKFNFVTVKTASTPIKTNKALLKDEEAEDVDVHLYRSMIGSLMYLTASRPDIMFVVCACARDSPFDLEDFLDSGYAGASLDRKSTTGDETVIKEWEDRMERAATTASSLEAEQDSGNINRTQSMATLNESFPQGTDSGSGPRCQDTILGVQKLKLERELVRVKIHDGNAFWNAIGVNAGVSKLMLLSLNLLLPVLVYAARHSLTAVRHKLMLPGITYYCWVS